MDCNQVIVSGKITTAVNYSHNFEGNNYYVCWIQSEFLRHDKTAKVNVRVCLSEKLASSLTLPIGTYIKVEGSIVNSFHDGQRDITVAAEKVTFPSPIERPIDYVKISGTVTRFFTNDSNFSSFVIFVVALNDEKDSRRNVSVRVVAWAKLAYSLYSNLYVGDEVTIVGSLSGAKYNSDKKPHFYNKYTETSISEIYCTACYINKKNENVPQNSLDEYEEEKKNNRP